MDTAQPLWPLGHPRAPTACRNLGWHQVSKRPSRCEAASQAGGRTEVKGVEVLVARSCLTL